MANNHHNRISILIVDDHEVVRNGIRAYLETVKEFQVIGEAASGEDAIQLVSEHIPDIVLLDLIMPGMDGVETTRRIKHISPRTQVVALTSYHEDVHIFPALKAGAIAYILKDEDGKACGCTAPRRPKGSHPASARGGARAAKSSQ